MTTEDKIKALEKELKTQRKNLAKERSSKEFNCGCGSKHKIKDCIAIQTHWYTSPSGCSGGDYWNEGELQIVCPDTDSKNRLLYKTNYALDYKDRNKYKYSAEIQFNNIYKGLFKSIVDDYEEDKRSHWNSYWIDNNHEYYGINIKGESK